MAMNECDNSLAFWGWPQWPTDDMSTGAATECRVQRGRAMWSSSDEGVYALECCQSKTKRTNLKKQKKKKHKNPKDNQAVPQHVLVPPNFHANKRVGLPSTVG